MKITKTQLKELIKEELDLINEAAFAPAIFQAKKKDGTLKPGDTIDFKLGHGSSAAGKQPKAAAQKGPVNKMAIIQALSPKVGKQASQFIIGALSDEELRNLEFLLKSAAN